MSHIEERNTSLLAYQLLQDGNPGTKETVHSLAISAITQLHENSNEEQRLAGYHIVASIFLWNQAFSSAKEIHRRFLTNQEWCETYPELVESYLTFAFVVGNDPFTNELPDNCATAFVPLQLLADTWRHALLDPHDERFTMDMVPIINTINAAKRQYGFSE